MRLCTAGAVIAGVVFPLLLECSTCQIGDQTDYDGGACPVKLTSTPFLIPGQEYSELVTVGVLAEAWGKTKAQEIMINKPWKVKICPVRRKGRKPKHCHRHKPAKGGPRCGRGVKPVPQWEQVYNITAEVGTTVSVTYSSSTSCTVSCTVPDPVPNVSLSVNQSSKSFTVTVDPGHKVYARWCYLKSSGGCITSGSPRITIDPSQSLSAPLAFPFLLPCLCVETYFTNVDARRRRTCPFQRDRLEDVSDVWPSSTVGLFRSHLTWSSECPAQDLQISAALCWRQHEHLCTPVLNLTQLESPDGNLKYDVSTVDKHPQLCVKFSLQGSSNVSCLFLSEDSSWEVDFTAGRQSVFLDFTSGVQANFSAQLCVLKEGGCSPVGPVHSAAMEENRTETRLHVPLLLLSERPCVQVWRSEAALSGRRLLCPDYTHSRRGVCAFTALVVLVLIVMLGVFICRLTKRGAAGWLSIQRPVLLVCSSEQADHVSAVCALASILQGDLSASVHMALWAQNSQTQTGASVADLGPLPWLYGQWDAVRKEQGTVLIVWSPEAKRTHETWREEREERGERGRGLEGSAEKACDDLNCSSQKEPSTVIAPVFTAALACLEGALQGCKGQGVALVYFQGLCHSKDIPKAFRGVPRFGLPQDFRGFIQELGGVRRQTETDKVLWRCWPRLLSKVLSLWLAQRLAQRLRTLLLQTPGTKTEGRSVPLSQKQKSGKTQSRLRLPLTAGEDQPGSEHEPLHVSPWRAETL